MVDHDPFPPSGEVALGCEGAPSAGVSGSAHTQVIVVVVVVRRFARTRSAAMSSGAFGNRKKARIRERQIYRKN